MNYHSLQDFTYSQLCHDKSGHSLDHIKRVEGIAKQILTDLPQADPSVTLAIVWLHEAFDDKLDFPAQPDQIIQLLETAHFTPSQIENIIHSIQHLSFSKNLNEATPLSIEGQIAQDADRLDAMGAIGIARTFYYGGAKGHLLYSHDQPNPVKTLQDYRQDANCLHHFDVKLLKLYDLLNTDTGRQIGYARHQFMLNFLQQFKQETQLD